MTVTDFIKPKKSNREVLNSIKLLIENGKISQLRPILNNLLANDLLILLKEVPDKIKTEIFLELKPKLASKLFKLLDFETQKHLVKSANAAQAAKLFSEISPDDRTAFLSELPPETVSELIKILPPEERTETLKLLGYPSESIGRLMTPDYIAVKKDWTVKQVLNHIKHSGQNSETVNVIYVVDDKGHLIDDIRIREFLFADEHKKVADLMDNKFTFLKVNDDREVAVNMFRKNNRFAFPVLDEHNLLLGMVTIDDVLRVAEQEETEDIQKFGGLEALDMPYRDTSINTMIKKRAGWLVVLFLGEMFTATAMSFFEGEISKAVVLALFIPLIISSGGNSGSQAATLIIRAMAIKELKLRDWWFVMRKEIQSGFALGAILGAIGFFRILLWQKIGFYDYGIYWVPVAFTVAFTLIGIVMWGTIAGSMVPFVLKRFKKDPATSSAPFVATLVDVTGLVIYFSIAALILKGKLL
jgi:magnesium transporter